MRDHKLIGYSLSLCVLDIMTKSIPLDRIEKIIAGTAAQSEQDWDRLLDSFCLTYWRCSPHQARTIVKTLRESDRIKQPRLTEREYHHGIYTTVWNIEP